MPNEGREALRSVLSPAGPHLAPASHQVAVHTLEGPRSTRRLDFVEAKVRSSLFSCWLGVAFMLLIQLSFSFRWSDEDGLPTETAEEQPTVEVGPCSGGARKEVSHFPLRGAQHKPIVVVQTVVHD